MDENVVEWKKQLAKCIRCGTCRSVCPVFKKVDSEAATARGKVKLIEAVTEGKLELTPALQERMSRCLLCKLCVEGCPSGVKTDELFLSARKVLADKNGVPLLKKMAFTCLTYRKLFDLGLRTGATFQKLIFKDAPGGKGKNPRLSLPGAGLSDRRVIPALATKPLRSRLPLVSKAKNKRFRVAFFPGCMLNYVYPEAGVAIVDVLTRNGVEVVLPEALYCCGAPAFTSGDFNVGQYLAGRNVESLSSNSFDAIITGCASCGTALKHDYGMVISDPDVKEKWQSISAKVYDFTQYLVEIGYSRNFGKIDARVTYHDPCHLVRGMKATKEPREIIQSIPGVEFVEMKDASVCCGSGGTFSLSHYELSRQINDEKLNNAESTGANLLLTGCSACRMHMNDGLSQRGSTLEACHTAEFIAKAYKAGETDGDES